MLNIAATVTYLLFVSTIALSSPLNCRSLNDTYLERVDETFNKNYNTYLAKLETLKSLQPRTSSKVFELLPEILSFYSGAISNIRFDGTSFLGEERFHRMTVQLKLFETELSDLRKLYHFDRAHVARDFTKAYLTWDVNRDRDYSRGILDFIYDLDWRLESEEGEIHKSINNRSEQIGYGGTPGHILRRLVSESILAPGETFIDVGSGFGRILIAMALLRSDVQFVGIELMAHRVEYAQKALTRYGLNNVTIINENITSDKSREFLEQATSIYLFNPLSAETKRIFENYLAYQVRMPGNKLRNIHTYYTGVNLTEFFGHQERTGDYIHYRRTRD